MSEYTDMKDHTYPITQQTILSAEEREALENEIVEELYRIFTHTTA